MNTDLRERLSDLGADQLLELIERLYGRDEAIDREIEVFATRSDTSEHVAALRGWIRKRARSRQFVPYQRSFELARELAGVITEMESVVERGEPLSAFELVEEFLKSGEKLIEQTDDSSGSVSMEIQDGAILWLRAAHRCREKGVMGPASGGEDIDDFWIDRLERLMDANDYGLLDDGARGMRVGAHASPPARASTSARVSASSAAFRRLRIVRSVQPYEAASSVCLSPSP